MNETYRFLDEKIRLLGLSKEQWFWVVICGALTLLWLTVAPINSMYIKSSVIFVLCLPVAYSFAAQGAAWSPGRLLSAAARWRRGRAVFEPGEMAPLESISVDRKIRPSVGAVAPELESWEA